MKIIFKITRTLLATVRTDLQRPHDFAAERVGFIGAGFALTDGNVLAVAQLYRPVEDEDYLPDDTVGAMMGPSAIRKAMQWSLTSSIGIFHVHSHGGIGRPHFSSIDLREQTKFMPSFFNVCPRRAHGAVVLSNDSASGRMWLSGRGAQCSIEQFIEVGIPLRKWSAV